MDSSIVTNETKSKKQRVIYPSNHCLELLHTYLKIRGEPTSSKGSMSPLQQTPLYVLRKLIIPNFSIRCKEEIS